MYIDKEIIIKIIQEQLQLQQTSPTTKKKYV